MIGKIKYNLLRKVLSDSATKRVIVSQYHSALSMMKEAIVKCSDELWNSDRYKNRYWHICYHALFYADLYLSDDEYSFSPWTRHRKEYQFLGEVPYPPYHQPHIEEFYSKTEILEYLKNIINSLESRIAKTNLDGTSGFFWLPFDKLELQVYNIRHIQHHTAQLVERLRQENNVSVEWIGCGDKLE